MHSYDVSDKKSPYPSECFDIGLCGLLALKQPHKHHKDDDGCTTYQVKVDIPIAHNEKKGKLDCDVIIAVLEEWNLDNSYIHFVTIHFSTSFKIYQNGSTASLRSVSDMANHRYALKKGGAIPLTVEMYTNTKKPVPCYQAYTKCLLDRCTKCYPKEWPAERDLQPPGEEEFPWVQ